MTETRDDTYTWLTQEAYDRLKAELDHLSGPGRIEIAKKIEAAREEGDLKENGGYHAAKDEQGMQEARIRQLTQLLENSRVGEAPRTEGVVGPGMTVTVRFEGDDEEVTFLLASREEVGSPDRRLLAEVPAGQRDLRQEGRRDRHLQPAERPRHLSRDPRGGPVRRHLTDAADAGPRECGGPASSYRAPSQRRRPRRLALVHQLRPRPAAARPPARSGRAAGSP